MAKTIRGKFEADEDFVVVANYYESLIMLLIFL